MFCFSYAYELVIGIGVHQGSGSITNPSKSTGLGLGIAGISDSSGQERILSSSFTSANLLSNAGTGLGPSSRSTSRIMQILETHESLPTALMSPPGSGSPATRELKRVHAEHYSSFVLSNIDYAHNTIAGHLFRREYPFGHSPQTQSRAHSAHGTSHAGTTVSTPGFPSFSSTSFSSTSIYPDASTFSLSSLFVLLPRSPWLPSPLFCRHRHRYWTMRWTRDGAGGNEGREGRREREVDEEAEEEAEMIGWVDMTGLNLTVQEVQLVSSISRPVQFAPNPSTRTGGRGAKRTEEGAVLSNPPLLDSKLNLLLQILMIHISSSPSERLFSLLVKLSRSARHWYPLFCSDALTLAADALLQITNKSIVAATTNKRQVVVALSSAELVYFELDLEGQLNEYQDRKATGSTVLALSIGEVPEDRGCSLSAARIKLSLDRESTLETISLQVLTAPPSSICIAGMMDFSITKVEPVMFVNMGLQNGVLDPTTLVLETVWDVRSIRQYVLGIYKQLGLREKDITKVQTVGPDCDLGSSDKTVAIIDGSGVLAADPARLKRLTQLHVPVGNFDKSKLSKDGGRLEAINIANTEGKPHFKYIVEGANLFLTQQARLFFLEKRKVIVRYLQAGPRQKSSKSRSECSPTTTNDRSPTTTNDRSPTTTNDRWVISESERWERGCEFTAGSDRARWRRLHRGMIGLIREVDGDGAERILDKDRDKDKGLDELRERSRADEEDQTITINRQLGQNPPIFMNCHNKDESVAARGNRKVGIGCVSYDVNKDGVKVAVLTFTKAAYRLGETVQGVVELNERTSRARVVQHSAHLKTLESLPTALASPPSSGSPADRELKRFHAEHYGSFVLSTMRTTFSLDIPSDVSAVFPIKVGNEKATGHGLQGIPLVTVLKLRVMPILLKEHPMPATVPASAPAYPSTFPLSSPLPLPSSPSLPSLSPSPFPAH
ncbi:hypothetical protein K435DRAFT_858322 [Dendrothele bispora CBS 962.96]|uniref:RSE1/DDB1/CPSF1 second beta-propeller domain-containing protein n=1 Tax=Dendrothele bispora (strain CBS 962.96) TaxID=1314807 RepID=A0A4S8M3W6_DENBC|nr:hypothetical protein K435DRAFT_858322 [Dendrothele bispora CBS 962.96]